MNKQELQIFTLNNEMKTKLAPSPIHGIGVFTMRSIKAGEKLHCIPSVNPQWYTLPYASLTKLFPEVRELILQRWPSVINGSAFLSPNDTQWLVTYINHSSDSNVINYDVGTDTALRDISKDSELFEDYRRMKNYSILFPWIKE